LWRAALLMVSSGAVPVSPLLPIEIPYNVAI